MPKFIPRQRKHRVIARQKAAANKKNHASNLPPPPEENLDTNTTIVLPEAKSEHETRQLELRRKLQAEQPKMSSQKQKRLDKYIETKLRKDENVRLIKRLEGRTGEVDLSGFSSVRTLGQRVESKRDGRRNGGLERGRNGLEESEGSSSAEYSEDEGCNGNEKQAWAMTQAAAPQEDVAPPPTIIPTIAPIVKTAFGSGLKRPLDIDEDGRPIIKTRVRSKGKGIRIELSPLQSQEAEWGGFSDVSELPTESEVEDDDSSEESVSGHDNSDNFKDQDLDSNTEDEDGVVKEDEDLNISSEDEATKVAKKARKSAFTAWAEQQRNEAIGFTPSTVIGTAPSSGPLSAAQSQAAKSFIPREPEQEPLPEVLLLNSDLAKDRKANAVQVDRTEEITNARLALPILAEEQRIMEAVFNNDVVLVSGATGSGKTTQVPQFLFENGFGDPNGSTPGMIGITQPRRVAAVSMAMRVSEELGSCGQKVAHQIRFHTTVRKNTVVKFMTDGVLLREMSEDFSLKKYSVIIIDEAHERTVNTDILVSFMSRCVKVRRDIFNEGAQGYTPLKLIIMSATLRVSDFRENTRLFPSPPPLVQAEGRQYDVTPHWTRKTTHDYVEEAFKKVSRGHRKLPPGGMLVFLTGQNEIRMLASRLKDNFAATNTTLERKHFLRPSAANMAIEAENMEGQDDDIDDLQSKDDENLSDSGDEDPDAEFQIEGEEAASETLKIHVLPLYSQLPSKDQLKIFEEPPPNSRLIVIATNVAETSLTIPRIRYVFDSGRHKERTWDRAGVQTFKTTWISKASADQRMGRAGRTGAGHCYRLYSSAIYESAMPDFAEPEIMRTPLEGVVLQLKTMNLARVDNFPFPTPPDKGNIIQAERLLKNLGALDASGKITKLGGELQNYPLNPRFAQMLRLGVMHDCSTYAVAMVAALDVPEIIIPDSQLDLRTPVQDEDRIWSVEDNQAETARDKRRAAYNTSQAKLSRLDFNSKKVTPQSDALKAFAAVYDYTNTLATSAADAEAFSKQNFLREKGLKETTQLREQLTSIIRTLNPITATSTSKANTTIPKPSDKQIALLKQIVAAGFIDQIAVRADKLPVPPAAEYRKPKRAIDVRYKTLSPSTTSSKHSNPDEDVTDDFVYIHPSSLLSRLPTTALPTYIVYHHLQKSTPSTPGKMAKVRMFPLTPISGAQIASLIKGTALLNVGKPIGKIEVLPSSANGEERREGDVLLSIVGEGGGAGWSLCRKRVQQRRVRGRGWVVERYLD
ncbi:P-loop containing nucleoside triphosphate hydrolase protein [Tothia fuscella]|uniref:RNA helicase n=1 Tax=Tothia fuscella TaxID=1048955 RepID=A0A9P4TZ63_9PEZI|nr:P-loop containing nucleoside triphosphate hydrolase protein [Tothia fuscella]